MKETDRAFAAGLIEGDGCITLAAIRKKDKLYLCPRVQVTNTQRELCERMQEHFGGGIARLSVERPHHKQRWNWYVDGANARRAAEAVRPYLVSKRPQAALVLAHYTNPEAHLAAIRSLNQRGSGGNRES